MPPTSGDEDSGGTADAPVSMSNTKDEIVDAAVAAGLCSIDEAESMTKAELLGLWEE